MEIVVIVAVGILGAVFIGSFGCLMFICYQRYVRKRHSLINADANSLSQHVPSLEDNRTDGSSSSLELATVVTCDDGTIRQLLETETWANDVHGVIPHCIAILKMCREVTEKLVTVAMDRSKQNIHPSHIAEIVTVAKYITPRVDDVMKCLSPPIDPVLLESRSAALIYSVQHLALLVRNAWQSGASLDWVDAAMENMAQHMKILKDANPSSKEDTVANEAAKDQTDVEDDDSDIFQLTTSQECSQL